MIYRIISDCYLPICFSLLLRCRVLKFGSRRPLWQYFLKVSLYKGGEKRKLTIRLHTFWIKDTWQFHTFPNRNKFRSVVTDSISILYKQHILQYLYVNVTVSILFVNFWHVHVWRIDLPWYRSTFYHKKQQSYY